MEAMYPVDEEPYEVSLDNHGCCDGPKTGRLRTLGNVSSHSYLPKKKVHTVLGRLRT